MKSRHLLVLSLAALLSVAASSGSFAARKKYNDGKGIHSKEQSAAYWRNTKRCDKLQGKGDVPRGYASFDACLKDY